MAPDAPLGSEGGVTSLGHGARAWGFRPCPQLPGLSRGRWPRLTNPASHTAETTIVTHPVQVPGVQDTVPSEGTAAPARRPQAAGPGPGPSGAAQGQPPPQPPAQAVLDPALLPLPDGRRLVGRPEHGEAAAPAGRAGSSWGTPWEAAPGAASLPHALPSGSAGALPPRAATRGGGPGPAGAPPGGASLGRRVGRAMLRSCTCHPACHEAARSPARQPTEPGHPGPPEAPRQPHEMAQ